MLKNLKACYVLTGLFIWFMFLGTAQDQRVADSLRPQYESGNLSDEEKLAVLRELAVNEINDLDMAIEYAEELLILAREVGNPFYEYHSHLQKGNTILMMGELNEALTYYFKAAEVASGLDQPKWLGSAYIAIADTYSEIGNSSNAESYYERSIAILRETDDLKSYGTGLLNYGDELFNSRKFDEALTNFKEAGEIFDQIDFQIGNAYNFGNIGMVYAELGEHELARKNIDNAVSILEEQQNYYPISEYLTYMADIYIAQNDVPKALSYAQRSLELAEQYDLQKQLSESNLKLSEIYEIKGDLESYIYHYKDHITYRDSLKNLEGIEEMADLRTDYEVSQKQIEVDLLNEQKRNQKIIVFATAIALFLIGLLALGLYSRNKYIQRTNRIIKVERDRSEHLLLNILPVETAEELKINGKVKAKKFDSVSILFTDFKNFTQYAEDLSPEQLVDSVDFYFSKFDAIIQEHGLEKIKTVGDAYMCVAGIHGKKDHHASRLVLAAMDMVKCVAEAKNDPSETMTQFDIRIGINTGPVVAGVVGTRKFAYDIWGDSVNVASRMESGSAPGKINISESTYNAIQDDFNCEYRGEFEVKNRGYMKMYFVNGLKSEKFREKLNGTP